MLDRKLVSEIVLNYMRDGMTLRDSCALGGVSKRTFHVWVKEDPALYAQLQKARLECKVVHVRNIRNHAQEDWKASAWLLERMFPKEFSRRTVIELPNRDADEDVFVRVPTPEEAQRLAIERARAKGIAEANGSGQGGVDPDAGTA
jgi:hypothetical protein